MVSSGSRESCGALFRRVWRLFGHSPRDQTSLQRIESRRADGCFVTDQYLWKRHRNVSIYKGQKRSGSNPCALHVPIRSVTCRVLNFGVHCANPIRLFEGRVNLAARAHEQFEMGLRSLCHPTLDNKTNESRRDEHSPIDTAMRRRRSLARCRVCFNHFSWRYVEIQ